MPYTDDQNEPVYWYSLQVKNDEYAKVMSESQHYSKLGVPVDPRIPKSLKQAMYYPAMVITQDFVILNLLNIYLDMLNIPKMID